MKLNIEAILSGEELVSYFIESLAQKDIKTVHKEGSLLPVGIKILVTNKQGEEIAITPDKIKFVYNG